MDLSAVIKAVLAPLEAQTSGDAVQDLQPGDKLIGRVLKIESDGRVLIDFGRSRALAQIGFKVNAGQVLNLQVIEAGPVLHLKADGPGGIPQADSLPMTDFSKVLTGAQQQQLIQMADRLSVSPDVRLNRGVVPNPVQHAMAQVRSLFDFVPVEKPVDQIAQWIKGVLEDRGVLFEKRLADWSVQSKVPQTHPSVLIARDIKPQLLILKQFLTDSINPQLAALKLDPRELDSMQQSVDRLLGHVEQLQEKAVARWESGESQQILAHLVPFAEQQSPLQLKVYYPRKHAGKDSNGPCHIALLLDLDRLGAVRVDLALIAEQLHIRFFVNSETLKALFQQEIHGVEASLAAGFKRLQVEIFVSRDKIAQFHQEDQKGAAAGRIDIIA